MKANYHTHTWRCNHASGSEREYVENAIQRGISTLGFSDHTPYLFTGDYYSTFRMQMEQLPDYVQTIELLRKEYAARINILLGLETEYYPSFFPNLLPILKDHGIEYLILGQHFTRNELDGVYSGRPTSDERVLRDYCCQAMDAMQTGCFTYFAHPDLINFVGDLQVYRQQMRRLFREANTCGIPLEINFLGLEEKRHYPGQLFLEIAAEENCRMIFGCDAHTPGALSSVETEKKAELLVKQYGLEVLDSVPARTI